MALTDVLTGAISVGRSLLGSSRAVDVVAILGPNYTPLFSLARPLAASIHEDADLMEHPLETGAVIADHIVIAPLEIELPCIVRGEVEYRNTYSAIKDAFLKGTLLTVMTRTGMYDSMVIQSMPHEERPESFDAIAINISLRHAVFIKSKSDGLSDKKVSDPKQASTKKRGQQQTTPTPTSRADAAAKAKANSGAAGTPAAGAASSGSTLYRWAYGS